MKSLKDQKTEPNEQYGEVGHVTDTIDHGCVQAYDSMCIEDVLLRPPKKHEHEYDHEDMTRRDTGTRQISKNQDTDTARTLHNKIK